MSNQQLPLLTHHQCVVFLKAMKEFGYPKLTLKEVQEIAKQVHENTDSETNVIASIMRQQITDAIEVQE